MGTVNTTHRRLYPVGIELIRVSSYIGNSSPKTNNPPPSRGGFFTVLRNETTYIESTKIKLLSLHNKNTGTSTLFATSTTILTTNLRTKKHTRYFFPHDTLLKFDSSADGCGGG